MIEAIFDLETWGIRTTSVVRSVGAVVFEGRNVLETHYFRIDETEQCAPRPLVSAHGAIAGSGQLGLLARTVDQSTVDWWHKPENAEAQATIARAPLIQWEDGRTVCGKIGDRAKRVWAKPGMFDLPMLRDLFGQDIWPYWKENDLSTLLAEFDPLRKTRPTFDGVPHNALDDAKHAHTWLCDLRDHITRPARDIRNATEAQGLPGNADVNEYMRGMANGLILADSIVRGIEPKYIDPLEMTA